MRRFRIAAFTLATSLALLPVSAARAQYEQDDGAQRGQQQRQQQQRQRQSWQRQDQQRQQQRWQSEGAQRQQQGQRGNRAEQFISRFDRNNNNRLERNELPPPLRERFQRLDRDNNNAITAGELRQQAHQARRPNPAEVVYMLITEADQGGVSLDDLQEAYQTLQRIDQNNDNQITREELRGRRQEIVSRWVDRLIRRADQNGDDVISRREAQGTPLARQFQQLDRNNDDRLTRNELRRLVERRGQQDQQQTARGQRNQQE